MEMDYFLYSGHNGTHNVSNSMIAPTVPSILASKPLHWQSLPEVVGLIIIGFLILYMLHQIQKEKWERTHWFKWRLEWAREYHEAALARREQLQGP